MKLGCMLVNYNNGSGSRLSDCGAFPEVRKPEPDNFLELCLDSYFRATVGDWPFVIVDDGSSDDSADLIDKYSPRLARFVREKDNIGLTRGMNKAAEILISEYGCDVICRFDADIEFLTRGWDLRFLHYFQQNRKVGAVGACQLLPYGAVWALGDMLVHPAGYTHILNRHRPDIVDSASPLLISPDLTLGNIECDSVMGCLAAFRSVAFTRVKGLRSEFDDLRGETEDLNLRLLLEGYQCVALGSVQFIHRHMEHGRKNATYDQEEKQRRSMTIWPELWGWDKMRPDMRAIYAKWKGTLIARNLMETPGGGVEYVGPQ